MKTLSYVITDELGMHARPAGLLAKAAQSVKSEVLITCKGQTVDCTKVMALMGIGIQKGDEIIISCQGEDEVEAVEKLSAFCKEAL